MRSSAYSMAQICLSQIIIPDQSLSKKLFGSFKNNAKSKGDNKQPCLSPLLYGKNSVNASFDLTQDLTLEYMDFMMLMNFSSMS